MENRLDVPIQNPAANAWSPVSVHVTVSTPENQSDHFLEALLATPVSEKGPRNPLKLAVSFLLHFVVLGALLAIPLYFSDTLNLDAFQKTLLVAPPAPAPPPAPMKVVAAAAQPRPLMHVSQLTAPTVVPKAVAMVKDAAPSEDLAGLAASGPSNGSLDGIIGGTGTAPVAPPPPAQIATTPKLVHVGGDVRPPALLQRVSPRYPPIARAGHVEGDVIVDAVIDEQGNVVQAHTISGPALLIGAALQAVSQWKYQPTILNGQPVSVAMHVTVEFRLQH